MAKKLFDLRGQYEGLRARRLSQCGRVVFHRIINDPPPYWLVQIKSFDEELDRPLIAKVTGSKWGNGTWRFVSEGNAQATFDALARLPVFIEEEEKRQSDRQHARERMQAKPTLPGIANKVSVG